MFQNLSFLKVSKIFLPTNSQRQTHILTLFPQMVSQRLEEVLFYLSEGLEAKVFDKKTMEELKYLDTLLDSAGLQRKVKSSSTFSCASENDIYR